MHQPPPDPERRSTLAVGTRLGSFELIALLGRGGMGEVWRARDTRLRREVAVKTLSEELVGNAEWLARFEREARALAALNHPNIAGIYNLDEIEVGGPEPLRLLVLDLVEGPTLADRIEQGPVAAREAVAIARQIAEALEVAHAAGITHRDIKPSNIKLTPDGRVKVLDFGLARAADGRPEGTEESDVPTTVVTAAGRLLGTPAYMSPEQIRAGAIDHRTDLWAFGCVLFELLTGSRAFRGSTVPDTLVSVLEREPDWARLPASTPRACRTLIERCLVKTLEQRVQSAAEVRRDLTSMTPEGEARGQTGAPSLPIPRTPLIGREEERSQIVNWLTLGQVRLLTLTGPGGSGKTSLALQVASDLSDRFAGGVRFVPLAGLSTPESVAPTIAQAFGLRLEAANDPEGELCARLPEKVETSTLLLLDNFEHLLPAAPVVVSLLDACPALTILATSRTQLRLSVEREYAVPPLQLPESDSSTSVRELARNPAVALFVARASAVRAGFVLSEQNAEDVVWICRRLDGLPLALELAAARVKLFGPSTIRKRLSSRLSLLTGGPRDLPDRQQTLRNALDWSHELLSPAEQRLFRRLAVFSGGFTLEAAEAVANVWRDLDAQVLDGIVSLVEQSVLQQQAWRGGTTMGDDEPRFIMLETVREYALERLADGREERTAHKAHAAYFLVRAEESNGITSLPDDEAWLAMCDVEHDNIRAAFDWLLEHGPEEWAIRMGTSLFRFWDSREQLAEGTAYVRALLQLPSASGPTRTRADILSLLSGLAFADDPSGFYEVLEICRQLGDPTGVAGALNNLGLFYRAHGDYAAARGALEECLTACRELGSKPQIAGALNNLSDVIALLDEPEKAWTLAEEARAIFEELGDARSLAPCLSHLADIARTLGNPLEAQERYQEAMRLFDTAGDHWGKAGTFTDLGFLALDEGDFAAAAGSFTRALELLRVLDHRRGVVRALEGVARLTGPDGRRRPTRSRAASRRCSRNWAGARAGSGFGVPSYSWKRSMPPGSRRPGGVARRCR